MNYINILGNNVPSYGLIIILGLIISNIVGYIVIRKYKLLIEDFLIIESYFLGFALIGAKLLYLFVSRNDIDWSRIFEFEYFNTLMQGGFVFYGGLIGGFIGCFLVKSIHKIDVVKYLSTLIFCIPLAHGFGRVACYFAGCCYGMPYSGPFSVEYHNIPYSLCDVELFPVQLVEAICLFIFALIFLYLVIKKRSSTNLIFLYLICYSVLRFILEYFRYDAARGHLGVFSTSQWISIFILILMVALLIWTNLKRKTNKI